MKWALDYEMGLIPVSIGPFNDVDELLFTLNSMVHVSENIRSGLSNEAPLQSLVEKIKAMELLNAENKVKRPRSDPIDIVTGTVESSDDDWFDAICKVIESSDFTGRFVKNIVMKKRVLVQKTRKPYENHNRAKDLSNTVWGQMLRDPSLSVVGSWLNRKFRRRFRNARCIMCLKCNFAAPRSRLSTKS